MYYVLFNYTKGQKEKDFQAFRSEQETIDFQHENYKEIEVYRIIETARSYRLGLVVTEELIKSVLEPEEEQPEELTDEEKTEEVLEKADQVIKREEEKLKEKKKDWKYCTKCNSNRVAPRNTKGICSPCQKERKTDRPYKKRKSKS